MREESKKTKKNKSKSFSTILVGFVFVYLILQILPTVKTFAAKVTFPEREYFEEKYRTQAIIIKNETLYKSAGEGGLKQVVKDGDKIPAGILVAEQSLKNMDSAHSQKIEEIDNKINILSGAKEDIKGSDLSHNNIDENIAELIRSIQDKIQEANYNEAEILKEKLKILEFNKDDIVSGKEIIDENVSKLNKEKDSLSQELDKNTIEYYSKNSGILSFDIDGYEEKYKYSDRYNYKYEDLKKIQASTKGKKSIKENNEPIFKIINNYEWFMVLDGKDVKDVDKYKKGSDIRVKIDKTNIDGYVDNIFKEKDGVTILCRFNTDFDKIYDKRFMEVDLVRYSYDGYKIPKKAIVEEGKEKGVIIKDISGITRFRPVKVLHTEGDVAYVSPGDRNGQIKLSNGKDIQKTITKFDEILVNGFRIKEGTILK